MVKKLSTKSLIKLKMLRPDLADFMLRLKENENEERISSSLSRQEEETKDDFKKIKTIIGRDGVGINDIDLVDYELVVTLDDGRQKTLGNIRGPAGKDGYKPTKSELLEIIKPLIPNVRNGRDGLPGKDGRTPSVKELKDLIIDLIPKPIPGLPGINGKDGSPDTGIQIITKINDSKGIKIKADRVEGLKEEGKKIFEEQYIHRGGQRLRIREIDGTPNIADVREIRINNGSITDLGNGIVQISIAGTGFTKLETPDTPDDVRIDFRFDEEPTYLVINNLWYDNNGGVYTWTWDGSQITLNNAIQTNGTIWGFV